MSENVRAAVKVLTFFVVPLGLLFLLSLFWAYLDKDHRNPLGIYPVEESWIELVLETLFVGLFLLTFVLPLLVLKRELQKRRQKPASGPVFLDSKT